METLRALAVAVMLLSQQVSCNTFQYTQQVAPASAAQFYVYSTPMVAQPVPPADKSEGLPCASAGFFTHPTNCSRFYRCVDYVGTGTVFSVYEFTCPVGNTFVTQGKDTCVPSDCTEGGVGSGFDAAPLPQPVQPVQPQPLQPQPLQPQPLQPQPVAQDAPAFTYPPLVTEAPAVTYPPEVTPPQSQQPAVTYPPEVVPVAGAGGAGSQSETGAGSQQAGEAAGGYQPSDGTDGTQPAAVQPQQFGQGSVQPGGAYPQPGAGATGAGAGVTGAAAGATGAGAGTAGAGTDGAGAVAGGSEGCPSSYVQDETYCNVYLKCPDEGVRYRCTLGSVFNQAGQLCDLYNKEALCAGKQFLEGTQGRSDLVFIGAPQFGQQVLLPTIGKVQSPVVYSQPRIYNTIGSPFQTYYQTPLHFRI